MNFLSVFVLCFPLFLCILKNNKNELSISFYASYNLFSSKQCDFCVKIFFFKVMTVTFRLKMIDYDDTFRLVNILIRTMYPI